MNSEGEFEVLIKGKAGHFEHSESIMFGNGFGDILAKYVAGDSLSDVDIHVIGVHRRHVDLLYSDVIARGIAASNQKIRHHLSSESEVAVISAIVGKERISNAFSPAFPFLSSMKIDDLLALRECEWHHFEAFRKRVF